MNEYGQFILLLLSKLSCCFNLQIVSFPLQRKAAQILVNFPPPSLCVQSDNYTWYVFLNHQLFSVVGFLRCLDLVRCGRVKLQLGVVDI